MFELIKQHGVSGCAGVAIGILLVGWIQPTTAAGAGLILITSVFFSIIAAYAFGHMAKK
jgi:hypothetical protein